VRLKGKAAVVTGAASGFGEGIARRFAEEGAKVVVADLDGAGAKRVAGEIGAAAVAVETDVSRRADAEAMVRAAAEKFGRLDILVNNAGFTHRNGDLLGVDEETFDRIADVNMKAIYLSALAAVPVMAAQGGGVILTTASTAGLRPRPGLTWYNASKGWAITATKSMAVELAPKNIRVNCLCPGVIQTNMTAKVLEHAPPAVLPLGRLGEADEIARTAVFLCSDWSSFTTASTVVVDGGFTAA
jgi:3-oxoacyl-[acyl-carrier protein] reductase